MDLSKYAALSDFLSNSWSDVVSGFWKKYPNPYSTHVLTEDVLERKLLANGRLYTRRLLSKTNPLPAWGSMVFKSNMKSMVHIVEESVVDPAEQKMTVYTWNTSYVNMMDVQERLTIAPTSDPSVTEVRREGWVDSSLTGFRRVLRQFGITRWRSNAKKAFLGYQTVMNGAGDSSNRHIKERAMDSIKEAKDKAKLKAINIASMTKIVTDKSL
uniref:PRELI domain-containing protein 1, mitochondrial-like n=1 Tax=Ciona intestinalis TaxID=7719 RepID=F6S2Y7_CIOIN|nr:PRELI domain-containing protein 1, mitochondrial-like [Ciona intestinalis]|eukprot:XP_002131214.1 PRELI domain-containing protein 1, mitochondrial-like [Ciona intestinalis]